MQPLESQLLERRALRLLGLIDAQEVVDWAAAHLQDHPSGDFDALNRIAGLTRAESGEVDDLLDSLLDDLGHPRITLAEAGTLSALAIMRQIHLGVIEPISGARALWRLVYMVPTTERMLRAVIALASEWDELPGCQAAIASDIVRETQRILLTYQDGSSV